MVAENSTPCISGNRPELPKVASIFWTRPDEATQNGSRSAITDVGVAIALAEAGMRGASLNCRVNLAAIRDEAFRDETERRLREFLDRGEEIRQRAAGFVDEGL